MSEIVIYQIADKQMQEEVQFGKEPFWLPREQDFIRKQATQFRQ
ncbi:MAG: hypothetical protein ACK4K9_07160 [Bacteroidia bacterium]